MATKKKTPVETKPKAVEKAETPLAKRRVAAARVRGNKVAGVGKSQFSDFMTFVRTQGVVGLAVGLVLGGAVTVVVKSLIDNIVMPPIGFVLGSADGLKGLQVSLGKTSSGTDSILHYGLFLNDLINFIIIALVVYLIVHLLKFDRLDKKKE